MSLTTLSSDLRLLIYGLAMPGRIVTGNNTRATETRGHRHPLIAQVSKEAEAEVLRLQNLARLGHEITQRPMCFENHLPLPFDSRRDTLLLSTGAEWSEFFRPGANDGQLIEYGVKSLLIRIPAERLRSSRNLPCEELNETRRSENIPERAILWQLNTAIRSFATLEEVVIISQQGCRGTENLGQGCSATHCTSNDHVANVIRNWLQQKYNEWVTWRRQIELGGRKVVRVWRMPNITCEDEDDFRRREA